MEQNQPPNFDLLAKPEMASNAADLLRYFWLLTEKNLGTIQEAHHVQPDPLKAPLATSSFLAWINLTGELMSNFQKLHFCKTDIKKDETKSVPTLPEEIKTLGVTAPMIPLKFSCLEIMVDKNFPKNDRLVFPEDPQKGTPEIQIRVREIFKDSEREVAANIAAMQEVAKSGVWHGLSIPPEKAFNVKAAIEALLEKNQGLVTTQISVMGLSAHFDKADREVVCWPLLGYKIIERKFSADPNLTCGVQIIFGLEKHERNHLTDHPVSAPSTIFKLAEPWSDFDRRIEKLINFSKTRQ